MLRHFMVRFGMLLDSAPKDADVEVPKDKKPTKWITRIVSKQLKKPFGM